MIKAILRILAAVVVGCLFLWPGLMNEHWRASAQSGVDPAKPKPKPTTKPAVKPKEKSDSTAAKKPDTEAAELAAWEPIKNSTDQEDYKDFLKEYPNGVHAPAARLALRRLERSSAPVKPPDDVNTNGNRPAVPLLAGITANMLRSYDFTTPIIDSNGSVTNRKSGQATYFTENISGVSLEMTLVSGGAYWMGSTDEEVQAALADAKRYESKATIDAFKPEQPRHQVRVQSFYMGRCDVTIGQWKAVMGDIPEGMRTVDGKFKESDNQPVVSVSWDDAQGYCRRLSQTTGRQYRLPSEAEWEYAARGGTTTVFPYGETITPEVANYNGDFPYGNAGKGTNRGKTVAVGNLGAANAFGLYDIVGNVYQWCQDWYHPNYDGAPTDGSAWESGGEQKYRLLRGGYWGNYARYCRSAYRRSGPPNGRASFLIGLRVVLSARTP